MHADLSRISFRADRHYSMVLAQQGRVQLDSDLNEQAAIQNNLVRTLLADVIGPGGGPRDGAGFEIAHVPGEGDDPDDLTIGEGRYYVGGVLLDATRAAAGIAVPENGSPAEPEEPEPWTYRTQPDGSRGDLPSAFPYLACLKVWERSVTAAEDPALREVALGPAMPDTAARLRVVWQVTTLTEAELGLSGAAEPDAIRAALADWANRDDQPRLAARAGYRGPENQLYRVEIHDDGPAGQATLKWSRENGSVVFGVGAVDGTWVELTSLGSDAKLSLSVGDWVELVTLDPSPLLRVEEVDIYGQRVRLSAEPAATTGGTVLRRWESGAVKIQEGSWLPLEDGVEVYFAAGDFAYATGDHWLIPARTTTGTVEWPRDDAQRPLLLEPSGPAVSYAALAWVTGPGEETDLRLTFAPLAAPVVQAEANPKRRARKSTNNS